MWHSVMPLIGQICQGKESKSMNLLYNPDKFKVGTLIFR